MVELLLNGTANFAISHAADIPIRRTVVDFTLPTSSFNYAVVFRKPNFTMNKLALLKPFLPSLWMIVLAWSVTIALSLLVWQIGFARLDNDDYLPSSPAPSLNDCILYSVANTCLQSACLEEDDGVAWRSLAVTAATVSLILNAAYSGILFSFLSLRETSGGNLDAIRSTDYSFVLHNQSVFMLNQSIEGALPSTFLSEYSSRPRRLLSAWDPVTIKNVLKGKWVLMSYQWTINECLVSAFSLEQRCSLDYVMLPVKTEHNGLMIPKGSPLKRSLDIAILKTCEYGLRNLWHRRYQQHKPKCQLMGAYGPVSFTTTLVASSLHCIGIMLSLAVLAYEKCASTSSNVV